MNNSADAGASPILPGQSPVIAAGDVFEVAHPFCREAVSLPGDDPEGPPSVEVMSWRPGVRFETRGNPQYESDYTVEEIDGMGAQLLTVVAVFKPGKFPTRVFYTRKWRAPTGREFGKGKLHIKTLANFRAIVRGYRYQNPISLTTAAEAFADAMALASIERGDSAPLPDPPGG